MRDVRYEKKELEDLESKLIRLINSDGLSQEEYDAAIELLAAVQVAIMERATDA